MSANAVSDLNATLRAAMKKDGRENEKRRASAELTHEILQSEDSPDIKIMRLCSERGFGKQRATQLVTGKAYVKPVYKNTEVAKDFRRFYVCK